MKNLKKKALVSAVAGVFAFGAGFYMAPESTLPTLTMMQAAEAAAQWEQGTITAEGFGTPPMGTYGSKANIVPPSSMHSAISLSKSTACRSMPRRQSRTSSSAAT